MYEPDKRFINDDGSANTKLAMEAGREARSQALFEGISIIRNTAVWLFQRVRREAASLYKRLSSPRAFQSQMAR